MVVVVGVVVGVVVVVAGGTDAARIYLRSATTKWVTNLPVERFAEHASTREHCGGLG
jgi:hypothetical protein